MQEYIWVLCEELDPSESFDETSAKNIWTFNDFEAAKRALWKLMRTRACTENKAFDGKGGIRGSFYDTYAGNVLFLLKIVGQCDTIRCIKGVCGNTEVSKSLDK